MNRNPRIRAEFSKTEAKARNAYNKRSLAYVKDPSAYETERKARLAAYAANNGNLPVFQPEHKAQGEASLPWNTLGWNNAVQETAIPTRVEKPYRPTVFKYRPLTV